MNDIFVTFFILLAFVFHWRYLTSKLLSKAAVQNALAAGIFAGLAMGSKWSGVFVLVVFGLCELVRFAVDKHTSKIKRLLGVVFAFEIIPAVILWQLVKHMLELTRGERLHVLGIIGILILIEVIVALFTLGFRRTLLIAFSFVLLPISLYIGSYGQFWLQSRENNLKTFRDLHHQIWWYQTNLEAEHPWQSRPHEWLLNLKPVWYFVEYQDTNVANIYALANPAISWLGIIFMLALTGWGIKTKRWHYGYLFLTYLAVWTPWFGSPRIMFFYHYTPGIALLATGFGLFCWELISSKKQLANIIAFSSICITALLFVYFYPHWTGLSVSSAWSQNYYWLNSWKPH